MVAAAGKINTDAAMLSEGLERGAAASQILDALKKREEEKKQISQVPVGVVIAAFYVPYLCKSNCAPIAYVFPPSPDEPSEPDTPDEEEPTVAIEPTAFCVEDNEKYPIQASPTGGKLTINDKENDLTIVPATFDVGTFIVKYRKDEHPSELQSLMRISYA